jgi:hypothetical protein
MPRILATEEIIGIDNSPFIMVPGHLAKDGIFVRLFFYDEECQCPPDISDIRPQARIPSDANDSSTIEYVYEQAEWGYKFWTIEAGHRIWLDELVGSVLFMHHVNDEYHHDTAAESTSWELASPHHTTKRQTPPAKTLYLSIRNPAGRGLALSRARRAPNTAVVHFGDDYRRALAYADRYGCNIVIL